MRRRTVAHPVRVEGVGPHQGQPCAAIVHPTDFGEGLCFTTEEERIPVDGAHLEGTDGLVFYGELSEVGGAEPLLAALAALGITDARIEVHGGELPVDRLGPWMQRLEPAEGPAYRVDPIDAYRLVTSEGGYAALAPATPSVAVWLDTGPGCTGDGFLPLDPELLAAELGSARPVRLELEREQGEGRWLGLDPSTCVTREQDLATPDEGLRWHMVCALAGFAIFGPRGRIELRGPDLDNLARVLRQR